MTVSVWIYAASLGAVTLLAVLALVWQRCRHRRVMKRLMEMLDQAIGGTFTESAYDESLLSAVENRLNQYLSASVLSANNLGVEKEKIKQLIADISHQTKTPIANLLLYSQLLEEQELSAEGRTCSEALHKQAEKLSFLIASLVKLSRLESGVLTLHPQQNALSPMLEEVAAQFASKAERKGVALSFEHSDAEAVFDPKWTAEAIANLIDNGIKYTPAGGSIAVSVTLYDLFCRIDVTDTGMGIAQKEQAEVFARFYRSPAVGDREGVGIGLYLTRQILAEQGGYLTVRSQLGEGSVFSAFLVR